MKLFDYSWEQNELRQPRLLIKILKHPSWEISRISARMEQRLLDLMRADESAVNRSDFRKYHFYFIDFSSHQSGHIHVSFRLSDGSSFSNKIRLHGIMENADSAPSGVQVQGGLLHGPAIALKIKTVAGILIRRVIMAVHDISWRISPDKRLSFYMLQNPERIGHLATEPDIFFAEVMKGLLPKRFYVIVLMKESWVEDVGEIRIIDKLRDSQMIKMLKRKYPLITLSRQQAYSFPWYLYSKRRDHAQRDINGVLDQSPPHVQFTPSELRKGAKLLQKLGIPKTAKYVCLHMREPGFVGSMYKVPENRYSYRDVAAETYRATVDWLIAEGYYVVRMGVPPLPDFHHESDRFIHYPTLAHSSFGDVFLCANCEFFIGTTSGLYAVADVFRKPILFTNFAPLRHIHSWSFRHLTIPKLARHNPTGTMLTFATMLLNGVGDVIHGEKASSSQIEYLPNTSNEILDATKELVGRIRGDWKETPDDWLRQKQFWDLVPIDHLNKIKRARVSADFLRRYHFLLPASPTLQLEYPAR